MNRAALLEGITLSYDIRGTGEPVIFVHGALIADAFSPLLAKPILAGQYQLIAYRRRGYADSTPVHEPVTVTQQAADCLGLLRYFKVDRAHVVGHSYGGAIALQLALDCPEVVRSLSLLEPAIFGGSSAEEYREALVSGRQRYQEASAAAVVDGFLRARFGNDYRAGLDEVAPGTFDQAVSDAGTWFNAEVPGFLDWKFGEKEARRITQPVLAVLGAESEALWRRFGETHRLLLDWLPNATGFVLPHAGAWSPIAEPA